MKPPRKNRLIRQGTEEEIEMFWRVWQLEVITSTNMAITVFYDVIGIYVTELQWNVATAGKITT
jgi:hypothetical protein